MPNSRRTLLQLGGGWLVAQQATAQTGSESGARPSGNNAFMQAGRGAVSRSVDAKLRDAAISVKDFGAVGDGKTDDTSAVHAALAHVGTFGGAVYFPVGIYRVVRGFSNTSPRANVAMFGPTRSASDTSDDLGAIVMLDSFDPAGFFYEAAAAHHLFVANLRFRTAQHVKDRACFRFSAVSVNHRFQSVQFERVDRPIVYGSRCYFQSSSLIDVQFNDSGTIHSVSNARSIGNLLTLINVSHDGDVPVNSERIVCNLQGVRGIQATNFLLEGALPERGWEVLRLDNDYSKDWTHEPVALFNGFWSEWTVHPPAYVVRQMGGLVVWNNSIFNLSDTARQYKVEQAAQVRINGTTFTSEAKSVNSFFVIEDSQCNVILEQCAMRAADKSDDRFTFVNCSLTPGGSPASQDVGAALFDTSQSCLAYEWRGGYVDGDGAEVRLRGTSYTPSADETFGRKLVIGPFGNRSTCDLQIALRGMLGAGAQYNLVGLLKLPSISRGAISVQPVEDDAVVAGGERYDAAHSGQLVRFNISRRRSSATRRSFGLRVTTSDLAGGEVELYAFAIYVGNGVPRVQFPKHVKSIVTSHTGVPVAGAWSRGDMIWNSTPSPGAAAGWMCTASGTPGTWVRIASLVA